MRLANKTLTTAATMLCLAGAASHSYGADGDPQDAARLAERINADVQRHMARAGVRQKGAYLGVAAAPAEPVLRKQLHLKPGTGLVVEAVVPNSPAADAGLRELDVLQKLDDQLLINSEQLAVLVRTYQPGDAVKVTVVREGQPTTLTAKLAEHELDPLPQPGEARDAFCDWAAPGGDVRVMPQVPGGPTLPPPVLRDVPYIRELFQGGGPRASSVTWVGDDRAYTITTDRTGHQTVTVRAAEGKTLFAGPIDTPEQRDKLPDDVKNAIKKMREHLHVMTDPKPATANDHPNASDDANGAKPTPKTKKPVDRDADEK